MSELGVELRTVESYNPVTKEWRQLARMATPRAYVGVAVLDDYIYAVGGWNETRRALRTVERYSIEEVSQFQLKQPVIPLNVEEMFTTLFWCLQDTYVIYPSFFMRIQKFGNNF